MTRDNPSSNPDSRDPTGPAGGVPGKPVDPPVGAGGPDATPPRKRRWLRRLGIALGLLLVAIIILVLLLPTIASTGAVRNFVINKINQNLNGKIEIASWSIGWTGGISANGIRIYDAKGVQILQIPHFQTQLSILGAIRGQYHLGKTIIDGLDFNAERYADGTLNFSRLLKSQPASSGNTSGSSPAPSNNNATTPNAGGNNPSTGGTSTAPGPQSKLPNVDGDLQLTNCRGTFTDDQKHGEVVQFTTISGEVKIPGINQSISDSLKVAARLGAQGEPGDVSVDGNLMVAKNNLLLNTNQMEVHQKLAISHLDLASLSPLLPADQGISTLAGLTAGNLSVDLTPNHGGTFGGLLDSKGFRLGGPMLKGDTYAADDVAITIPPTAIDMSAPFGNFDDYRIKTTGAGGITIAATQPGGKTVLALAIDATPGMLNNLKASRPPGAAGSVNQSLECDLAPLTAMLPHMLGVAEGRRLTSGHISQSLQLALDPKQAQVHEKLAMQKLAGQAADHQSFTLQPVEQQFDATILGDGGALPDLRNLALRINTGSGGNGGYASADVKAATLADLTAQMHVALEPLQREWSQLVDFKGVKLAGTMDVAAASKGQLIADLAKPGQKLTADATLKVTGQNLVISGLKDHPPLDEPRILVDASATLNGGATQFIQSLTQIKATIQAGESARPTIDALFSGGSITYLPASTAASGASASASKQAVIDGTLDHLYINPAEAQRQLNPFLPLAKKQLSFQGGTIGLNGHLHYANDQAAVKGLFNTNKLVLVKGQGAAAQKVFDDYSLSASIDANYAAQGDTKHLTIAQLNIGDDPTSPQSMIGIENTGGKPIDLFSSPKGMRGSGSVHVIRMNLAQFNEIAHAFSEEPVQVSATTRQGAKLTSGWLAGTLAFSADAQQKLLATGNFDITALTVAVPDAKGLNNEQLKIALSASAEQNFATITPLNLSITGSMLSMGLKDARLQLKDGPQPGAPATPTLQIVRDALLTLDVPALEKLQALMDALSPTPAPGASQTATGLNAMRATAVASIDPASVRLALAGRPARATNATPAPGAAAAPTVPTKLTGGSLKGQFKIHYDPATRQLLVTPNVTGNAVQLTKDGVADPIGNLAVAGEMAIVSRKAAAASPASKAAPSMMDEIGSIHFHNLAVAGVGSGIMLNGAIDDPGHARAFKDFKADLNYNATMLWKAILPLMAKSSQESMKDVQVVGNYKRTFTVAGSLPADQPFNQAVKSLTANGELLLERLNGNGADLQNLLLPFVLEQGKARLVLAGKPEGQNYAAPATLNGGTFSIAGATLDLTQEHQTLTIPPNTQMLKNVSLNPLFAHTFLGSWVDNPLFVGATNATGQVNATIRTCNNLPIDSSVDQPGPQNKGLLDMSITIGQIQIGNSFISKLASALGSATGGTTLAVNSLRGDIKTFDVKIQNGIADENLIMQVGQSNRPLKLNGNVVMLTRQMHMNLDLPWAVFGMKANNQVSQLAGDGIVLPLTGPVNSPHFDLAGAVQKNLLSAPQNLLNQYLKGNGKKNAADNPLDLLKGLTGQGNNAANNNGGNNNPGNNNGGNNNPPASQSSQQQTPEDIVNDIGNLFNQGKKKDKKK